MEKLIDLKKTVAELMKEFPDLKAAMVEAGFKEITNPILLNTKGRTTTIPAGAEIKKIPMEKIIEVFEKHGFKVVA